MDTSKRIPVFLIIFVMYTAIVMSITPDYEKTFENDLWHNTKITLPSEEKVVPKNYGEFDLQKAEKIDKNFERMIQLVNLLGQVDLFLTDRTKTMLQKLATLTDDADLYRRRRRS